MTDAQLFAIYGIERIEDGWPKFASMDDPSATPEMIYREWLKVHAGITDLAKQAALWQAERAKRAQWRKEHDGQLGR
jgi:hypothetical protein